MKAKQLAADLTAAFTALDHPELTSARDVSSGPDSDARPHNHVLVALSHASGATSAVQVMRISGPGMSQAPDYRIPRDGW
ncbi:hypothetical protein [Actinokineospora bangkokensis]|uniref:Uncharacterized protein n=1 Tax=Actinokineospora bangkokensis TaxID=1193682 RepID=A0A1Q9LR76_9PSEU|nr:hypothetical protein [Actinokineospora bangkokensis]OLR94557.1 hypothetical protein BJP25_12525 [Actinokineospora bangkokensis]